MGWATPLDPNSPQAINPDSLDFLAQLISTMRTFVSQVYLPYAKLIGSAYPEWTKLGGGTRNFLTYGGYGKGSVSDTATYLFPRGIVRNHDLSRLDPLDPDKITEQIARSWYSYADGDESALHPFEGETNAGYTGPNTPYEWLETDQKYSWLKAPRFGRRLARETHLARSSTRVNRDRNRADTAGRGSAGPARRCSHRRFDGVGPPVTLRGAHGSVSAHGPIQERRCAEASVAAVPVAPRT